MLMGMMLHVDAVFVVVFFAARDVRTYGASHKEGRCLGTRKVEGLLIFHLNARTMRM